MLTTGKKSISVVLGSGGAYDIANQAFDAMQSTINRQKLAAYPPDKTIEIARNVCTRIVGLKQPGQANMALIIQ